MYKYIVVSLPVEKLSSDSLMDTHLNFQAGDPSAIPSLQLRVISKQIQSTF